MCAFGGGHREKADPRWQAHKRGLTVGHSCKKKRDAIGKGIRRGKRKTWE